MDGGAGQKQMSETIKKGIKQNAFVRREKRQFSHKDGIGAATETGRRRRTETIFPSTSNGTDHAISAGREEYIHPVDVAASSLSTSSSGATTLQSTAYPFDDSQSPPTAAFSTPGPVTLPLGPSSGLSWPGDSVTPIQDQLGPVMIYLDYVFPFLFPFYQPPLIETGRQWLLGHLCHSEVTFHIAASSSAYFFALVRQNDDGNMHEDCKAMVRNRLVEQMDMAVTSMRRTIATVTHHGARSTLLDRIRVMEEITQMLIVEIIVRRNVDWTIHLMPATVLFDEIFQSHGIDHSEASLAALLNALPSPFPRGTPQHKPLPNTADQSALVFFVSLLLFVDTIASTSLGAAPALQDYHKSLLCSRGKEKGRVRLETVMGCQNWALVAIGDISALCAWKRDAKRSGKYSVVKLVNLAEPISRALEDGFESLENDSRSQSKGTRRGRLESYFSRHDLATNDTSVADVTRIWAYAASIYLSVSLSGWQANSADTQANVANVLSLLQTIKSPAQLRSLSWPITVAGCLALPDQEDEFHRILGIIGPLSEFGAALNALHILEAVWSYRGSIDGNVWDIASCLSILGSSALLL